MKTITKDELKAVLDSHELWLQYGKGERAVLDDTDLSCAGDMLENAKLCRASLRGIKADGQSMRGIDLTGADLTDASLINVQMEEACLVGAVLDGINATSVDLTAADLVCTSMKRANLAGACLACAGLDGANLTNADLTGADLGFVDMDGTDMSGAKLEGVQLYGIHLYDSKKVKGAPIYTCGAPDASAYVWTITVLALGPADKWRWFMCGLADSGVLRKDLETALDDSFDEDEVKRIVEAATNLENKILNDNE